MLPCFASMRRASLFFALFILASFVSSAQQTQQGVTLIIDGVPAETPANDTLYLAGSFNDWNPKDKRYVFKHEPDGKYVLSVTRTLLPFQYKITRGSWETVEGDIQGKKIDVVIAPAITPIGTTIILSELRNSAMKLRSVRN